MKSEQAKKTILKRRIKAYFEALEWSIFYNDIELQNILFDTIFEIIPFKDETEKENYLNYSSTYKSFELFKDYTFNIINNNLK